MPSIRYRRKSVPNSSAEGGDLLQKLGSGREKLHHKRACIRIWGPQVVSEDVLLRFLNNGLIDVGGDDAKLEKLQLSAKDLARELRHAPEKTASYALVAVDPHAPAGDPVVKEALEVLRNRWATYVNTFSGTPLAVVRAMLLEALAEAATVDERIGVAFVALARNALPFIEVGDENAIWAELVGAVEARVDARAEREWATPDSISVSSLGFTVQKAAPPALTPGKTKRDVLTTKLQAAAGPQSGSTATSGNPHWPNSNQNWVAEFGNRAAETIADAIDNAIGQIKISGIDLSGPLNQLATAVSTYIEGTLDSVSSATAGLQRRTNLLWWKEALYSPIARVSYRNLTPESAAALMALDLHRQVPTFSPASVSAFLHEAVSSLSLSNREKTYQIRDLTIQARQSPELAPFRSAVSTVLPRATGRGPLLALIAHPEAPPSLSDQGFLELVGVPASALLDLPTWSTWLFRELQAARAAAESTAEPISTEASSA
jgi:hypothetical protein